MLRAIVLLSIFSCKDSVSFRTPNLPVYLELNLQSSANKSLMTPGGMLLVDQPKTIGESLGFGGLIIVRDLIQTKFYAFDASCPYENSSSVILEIDGFKLKCPQCKSEFDVVSGAGVPTHLPAKHPLRSYRCVYYPESYRLVVLN